MTIDSFLYELHPAEPLGALAQGRTRHGALLRVRLGGGEVGYADLHPWTELGDLPLAAHLTRLARGETTELSWASLAFAALDARARAAGVSLWAGLTVPPSHFLLSDIAAGGRKTLEDVLAEGFTKFKIKLGKDLTAEKPCLLDLASFLQDVSLPAGGPPRLRLDYNETLTPAQFADYFAGLETLRPYLDFIEDPFPFQSTTWAEESARSGINFAVDRAVLEETAADFAGVFIHKPARTGPSLPPDLAQRLSARRLIVTSYLDHPLGQLGAAWVAAQLPPEAREERHGLVSHRVYARTRFSEQLGWSGPRLKLPEGPGFGFEEDLAGLNWKTLL